MIPVGVLSSYQTASGGTLTYTATRRNNGLLNIGPASANREVVILLSSGTGVNASPGTYLTINGVQAELDYLHGTYGKTGHLEIWRAVVPTGTDVQITSNNSSYVFDLSAFYSSEPIIRLGGSSSQVNAGATSATFTLPMTQSGGSAIAGLMGFQDNFLVTSWDGIENLWATGSSYNPGSGGMTVTDGNALTVTATLSDPALRAFKIGGGAYAKASDYDVWDKFDRANSSSLSSTPTGEPWGLTGTGSAAIDNNKLSLLPASAKDFSAQVDVSAINTISTVVFSTVVRYQQMQARGVTYLVFLDTQGPSLSYRVRANGIDYNTGVVAVAGDTMGLLVHEVAGGTEVAVTRNGTYIYTVIDTRTSSLRGLNLTTVGLGTYTTQTPAYFDNYRVEIL